MLKEVEHTSTVHLCSQNITQTPAMKMQQDCLKCKWQSKKGDMAAELSAVQHDASPAFTRLFRPKAFDTTE
jgi:hypothetical protein